MSLNKPTIKIRSEATPTLHTPLSTLHTEKRGAKRLRKYSKSFIESGDFMIIDAVIFDLDGLILDTEKLYQRFWREAAGECGFSMTRETALALRSLDKTLARKLLCDTFGSSFDYELVKQTRIRLMSAYVNEHGISAKKGVRELCEYLRKKGIKTAIATATNYPRTDDYLTRAGVRDCFETIVCACDLPHGKPYPDVYLYACEKLSVESKNCIALEDSPNGVKSAHSAGLQVICVPDGGEVEKEILPLAFACAGSLGEVINTMDNILLI